MAQALHHNISGELTQELIPAGANVEVRSISMVNTHASTTCTVDMYISKKLTGSFYLIKAVSLPVGVTFRFSPSGFNNKINQFGLYIKLTKGASETPTVDVIIN
jgi:hypothetical protein